MEEIRVNRLPAITWRYLHVNDSPDRFEFPGNSASAVFSDKRYVSEGGTLPADFCGASAETLAAAKNYTDTKLKGKADRYVISASVTGNTLLLADKSDTQLLSAAAAALTLTLPETVTSGYECFFSFKSGATATTLTVPSGITWTGADCNSGKEFVPLANTVYEVGIRCIGFSSDGTPYLSARVGAC